MILVTGSLAFDHIMDFPGKFSDHIMPDKIHKINLSFYLETFNKQNGGTAGNIAYSLSLLNIPVGILATAGEDFDPYKDFLENSEVDTSNIKIIPGESTASAFIMTDSVDNQIAGFYPGAIKKTDTLSIKDISQKPDFAVISPDNPNAMSRFVKECKELNIPYLFDPGMQLPTLTNNQLLNGISGAEVVIGNDYEIDLIKHRVKDENIFDSVKVLITTLGAKGSVIKQKDQTIEIGTATPLEVVDPTGAGDAYRSGFLAGYLKKLDLKTCGQMGAVASCYAIEKYGTTSHTFSIEDFCKRYKENFKEELNI